VMMAFVKGTEPAVACGARRQGVPGLPGAAPPGGPTPGAPPQATLPAQPLTLPREAVESR
jgi:hypothetical protein